MKLTKKQTKALDLLEDNTTRELVFGGGAGSGKSFLGCYWVVKQCLKYEGVRYVIGRAKAKTLKETTLNSLFQVFKEQNVQADVHYKYNQQTGVIKFMNSSEILLKDLFLYPADPDFDELGSLEITGAFVDECNQIVEKAWNILKSRIRYKLDENNLIPKILGTCNPSRGWVYYNFYKPYKENKLEESKQFIQALVKDNNFISEYYKENLESLDEKSKQRLLYGNWDYEDDDNLLFDYQSLVDVFTNPADENRTKYLTVDPAGQGSDSTKISYWEGLTEVWRKTYKDLVPDEIVNEIREIAMKHNINYGNIAIDSVGLGEGIAKAQILNGVIPFKASYSAIKTDEPIVKFSNKSSLSGQPQLVSDFHNLRSQCIFKLASLVNQHKISSRVAGKDKEAILEELPIYKDETKEDGKRKATSKDVVKEQLGRSPDDSDCWQIRCYFELRNEVSNEYKPEYQEVFQKQNTRLIQQYTTRYMDSSE